jgi:hypothetical protein
MVRNDADQQDARTAVDELVAKGYVTETDRGLLATGKPWTGEASMRWPHFDSDAPADAELTLPRDWAPPTSMLDGIYEPEELAVVMVAWLLHRVGRIVTVETLQEWVRDADRYVQEARRERAYNGAHADDEAIVVSGRGF